FPVTTARYFRLVANSEINGNPWASIAELNVTECSGSMSTENSAPIWITTDYPPASSNSGDVRICIDYDGDGGSLIDINSIAYDTSILLQELGQYKIYDPDDFDQTGTRIWVCDGSDAILAGAWGQDPNTASPASPAIDLGTGLPNGIPFSISKCANLSRDINGNGLFDECDEVLYTIMVRNTGALPLSTGSINVLDTLPAELTYIDNSTVAIIGNNITTLADETTPATEFPLDEGGYQHNAIILPNDSILFKFRAVINNLSSATFVNNLAYAASSGEVLQAEVTFPVQTPIDPFSALAPADTTINCDVVPDPVSRDTCLEWGLIPPYNWLVHYVDSEETSSGNHEASRAFDGDVNTMWHTQTTGSSPGHPHELQLDLGANYELSGFNYTPRQDSEDGRIADYEFYVSMDGSSWGTAVAAGTWASSANTETVSFPATVARYVRLVALSEV
ncbi:MAG: discoidin domain-containing protein, partial [Bacteroidota bacterium]